MTNEGGGWYSYKISGWNQAKVIFNSNGQQIPVSEQPGYLVTQNSWIKDGIVAGQQPESSTVPVTFTIKDASTNLGQKLYISGNIAELGNWDPAKAIGPASNPNHPDWTITINLPVGKSIQFKAIKKDGSGNVVWEGGDNHTYTVSASSPAVDLYFHN